VDHDRLCGGDAEEQRQQGKRRDDARQLAAAGWREREEAAEALDPALGQP
jgi:hypothetical protein